MAEFNLHSWKKIHKLVCGGSSQLSIGQEPRGMPLGGSVEALSGKMVSQVEKTLPGVGSSFG